MRFGHFSENHCCTVRLDSPDGGDLTIRSHIIISLLIVKRIRDLWQMCDLQPQTMPLLKSSVIQEMYRSLVVSVTKDTVIRVYVRMTSKLTDSSTVYS